MRIDIIGQPATGKSTLAKAISQKLSIPHVHLDKFWFESGGKQGNRQTPNLEEVRKQVKAKVLEAIAQDSWVSDGLYSHIQPAICERADVIVLIEMPLWRRLLNHAFRLTKPHERHKQVSRWMDITFFFELIRRHFTTAPKLKKIIDAYPNKVVRLHTRKEIANYLNSLS